jgi:hypothetical protein
LFTGSLDKFDIEFYSRPFERSKSGYCGQDARAPIEEYRRPAIPLFPFSIKFRVVDRRRRQNREEQKKVTVGGRA